MKSLTILSGYNKDRSKENFAPLTLHIGEIYAIAGNTGSGKSRLIKDIEQLVHGDSVTGRTILIDQQPVLPQTRRSLSGQLISHLEQSMRFVLDLSVRDFIALHCKCREHTNVLPAAVIDKANELTPEPIYPDQPLTQLSGGQSRALMIADIALICDSPVVLIDEIENAGIDKKKALHLLTSLDKLVLIVTHDPHTALMANKRIIMKHGAVSCILERSKEEETLFSELDVYYERQTALQKTLRQGDFLS